MTKTGSSGLAAPPVTGSSGSVIGVGVGGTAVMVGCGVGNGVLVAGGNVGGKGDGSGVPVRLWQASAERSSTAGKISKRKREEFFTRPTFVWRMREDR